VKSIPSTRTGVGIFDYASLLPRGCSRAARVRTAEDESIDAAWNSIFVFAQQELDVPWHDPHR
jgi:hypothetical protein